MLNLIPIWAIVLVIAAIIVICGELGFHIDRPQRGFIRVSLQPLQELHELIDRPSLTPPK